MVLFLGNGSIEFDAAALTDGSYVIAPAVAGKTNFSYIKRSINDNIQTDTTGGVTENGANPAEPGGQRLQLA